MADDLKDVVEELVGRVRALEEVVKGRGPLQAFQIWEGLTGVVFNNKVYAVAHAKQVGSQRREYWALVDVKAINPNANSMPHYLSSPNVDRGWTFLMADTTVQYGGSTPFDDFQADAIVRIRKDFPGAKVWFAEYTFTWTST